MHVKFGLSNPSLVQSAFVSHGSDRQGSGTVPRNDVYNSVGAYYCVPEQLNPFPSVKSSTQVQVKLGLSKSFLSHTAFTSQGFDRQGSGTVGKNVLFIVFHMAIIYCFLFGYLNN